MACKELAHLCELKPYVKGFKGEVEVAAASTPYITLNIEYDTSILGAVIHTRIFSDINFITRHTNASVHIWIAHGEPQSRVIDRHFVNKKYLPTLAVCYLLKADLK